MRGYIPSYSPSYGLLQINLQQVSGDYLRFASTAVIKSFTNSSGCDTF